ncbi:hypothetical protein C5167_040931 [Papaver somniferum]|uniref:Uncharacterized protein n=1 Tax=Papaver somniferum TaxID=3469 RepID=A0A4Y7IIS6_PAPSO|nr:hypothetical protein C5167_040931 [Papaver somniferum]
MQSLAKFIGEIKDRSHMDDEYVNANQRDPTILITISVASPPVILGNFCSRVNLSSCETYRPIILDMVIYVLFCMKRFDFVRGYSGVMSMTNLGVPNQSNCRKLANVLNEGFTRLRDYQCFAQVRQHHIYCLKIAYFAPLRFLLLMPLALNISFPFFVVVVFQIKLGAVDQNEAPTEFVMWP